MEITVTDFFLIVWATYATISAFYYHSLVAVARRFTAHLIDDPEMYAQLRKTIQTHQEQNHGNSL